MRRFILYIGAMTVAIVFYALHQHLRVAFYPFIRPPMTPALMDMFFIVIYVVAGFIMFGALFEQIMLIREKRRLARPRMQSALTTAERARLKANGSDRPKESVFY